ERASQHTQEAYAILSEALQNPALAKDGRINVGGQRMLDEFVEPCRKDCATRLERGIRRCG
ncbi:MAG: hypothetical protein JXR94_00970, partial [Candidatus Hydrogenedentes bacterium]|nr:hypothetical protein [Candidatus Hydrogenedentota bacterium]